MMKLQGSMTALATPFRGGVLDEPAFVAHVERQLAQGTEVLLPIGTTGEAVTLKASERRRVVELCVKTVAGRKRVFAGAGSNDTAEAIEAMAMARDVGADGALVVTPYYNKPTQAGLVEHYRLLARAHPGFPIMVYNVPGRTSVDLLPDTVLRLCDLPEVVALKEATGLALRCLDILELVGDRLSLLSGDDFTVAPFLACGGRGVVSVSSNVAPRLMADLVAAGLKGDFATALRLQLKLQPLHRALFLESNPIPVKRALQLMGHFTGELRPPLFPMTEGNSARLEAELEALGLLP